MKGKKKKKRVGGTTKTTTELVLEESKRKRESETFFDLKIPTLLDVQQYAIQTKQDPQKANDFFTTQTANNWLHNGKPINNWQMFFDGYKKRVFRGQDTPEAQVKPTVRSIPKSDGIYF